MKYNIRPNITDSVNLMDDLYEMSLTATYSTFVLIFGETTGPHLWSKYEEIYKLDFWRFYWSLDTWNQAALFIYIIGQINDD